jgi:hypothetical protein
MGQASGFENERRQVATAPWTILQLPVERASRERLTASTDYRGIEKRIPSFLSRMSRFYGCEEKIAFFGRDPARQTQQVAELSFPTSFRACVFGIGLIALSEAVRNANHGNQLSHLAWRGGCRFRPLPYPPFHLSLKLLSISGRRHQIDEVARNNGNYVLTVPNPTQIANP